LLLFDTSIQPSSIEILTMLVRPTQTKSFEQFDGWMQKCSKCYEKK